MDPLTTTLSDIQAWYTAQCDGDWEHSFGVTIGTLDNPGWSVGIDLADTILSGKPFAEVKEGMEEGDPDDSWIICTVQHNRFGGMGDPSRLEEILQTFLAWAKSEPDWLAIPDLTVEDLDKLFWERLPNDDGAACCADETCERNRISYSIFCRKHHFEAIRHKPCPFE